MTRLMQLIALGAFILVAWIVATGVIEQTGAALGGIFAWMFP